jgi:cytochrome P450
MTTSAEQHVGRDTGAVPVIDYDYTKGRPIMAFHREVDDLRNASPVYWNTHAQGFWAVFGFEEVREAYQTPEVFCNDSQDPMDPQPAVRFMPTHKNPPDLVAYRQLLTPWFSPGAIRRIEGLSRDICARSIDRLVARGSCDYVHDFALLYPTEVFLRLVDLPVEDADLFLPWVETLFAGHHGVDKTLVADASRAIKAYFVDAMEDRRRRPRDPATDFLTSLMDAEVFGRPLEQEELLDMCFVLVAAGLDTTRSQLGFLMYHLATHDDDRRLLAASPERIPEAVEEGMRAYGIVGTQGRKLTTDVEFHGCPMKQGDMVWLSPAAANRDPRTFENADRFVLGRGPFVHLNLAAGPHRCLGSHLARHEMTVAIGEWLRRIPEFGLASDEPIMVRGGLMSPLTLDLAWAA